MSRKVVYGVTLTPEEKLRIGFGSPPRRAGRAYEDSPSTTPSNIVKSWTCEVELPDGTTCSLSYQRDAPRSHRFSYHQPVSERVWLEEPLEGGAYAIEQKAQELAGKAFAQAQQREQESMRRASPPAGYRVADLSGAMERLRVKTAKLWGGYYALCLRFPSGNLMPVGAIHAHPEAALAEYDSGQHGDALGGGSRYVIGICCRWQRLWVEPKFLAQRLPAGIADAKAQSTSQEPKREEA